MPLPLLFIGAAAATGLFGASKTAKAISDNSKAGQINRIANENVEAARQKLEVKRAEVADSFDHLFEEGRLCPRNWFPCCWRC